MTSPRSPLPTSEMTQTATAQSDPSQFICFIHGMQVGESCPKCPATNGLSGTAGSLVDSYLANRSFAIGALEEALKAFGYHHDRRAFRTLDEAAPYLLNLKSALGNNSSLNFESEGAND